ncbi:MAG: VOC family protein [Mycobacteriales bacterium]
MTDGVSLAPWLAVRDAARAVEFYRAAFGAEEVYRLDGDGGTVAVAQLRVGGSDFWVQHEPDAGGAGPVRMILSVPDPDAAFARAVAAGATVVFPVGEEHGWRTGRLTDPFGYDWETSRRVG